MQLVEHEWGSTLIGGWNQHGWVHCPARIGRKLARCVGAQPGEVVATDSTSLNLFKALACCLQLRPGRHVILSGQPPAHSCGLQYDIAVSTNLRLSSRARLLLKLHTCTRV